MKKIAMLMMLIGFSANAGSEKDFSKGNTVLEFYADWCPTCRTQDESIQALSQEPAFQKVHFVKLDFDKETELKKQYKVKGQSTLIYLKDNKEIARVRGETDIGELRKFLTDSASK